MEESAAEEGLLICTSKEVFLMPAMGRKRTRAREWQEWVESGHSRSSVCSSRKKEALAIIDLGEGPILTA
jgi:hypothetical protein